MNWKTFWRVALLLSVVFWAIRIPCYIFADYAYEKQFSSYWSLADKASKLDQKAEYISAFSKALESSGMQGSYNAIWLKTPDNSFDRNFEALTSLQSRMEEIKGMNIRSFEYQQAIAQITSQEQGEATHMLGVFEGCWYLRNHFWLWGWVDVLLGLLGGILLIVSVVGMLITWSDY